MKKVKKETKFGLHIMFTDKSNPIIYYNLSITELAKLILEWSVNYILEPNTEKFLISSCDGGILNLMATIRKDINNDKQRNDCYFV